jgi:hypothetical protein
MMGLGDLNWWERRSTAPLLTLFATMPSRLQFASPLAVAVLMLPALCVQLPGDYIWPTNPPRFNAGLTTGMTRMWHDGIDALFRIDHK